jgi:hypothetical protein
VVVASPKHPHICLKLELQASVVYDILQEISPSESHNEVPEGRFYVEKVTPELANAFARLLRTLENRIDLKVLSPSIIRGIHHRLMSSRFGTKIQQLGVVGSKTQKISKVVEHLRKDYNSPLKVTDHARIANMSPAAPEHRDQGCCKRGISSGLRKPVAVQSGVQEAIRCTAHPGS